MRRGSFKICMTHLSLHDKCAVYTVQLSESVTANLIQKVPWHGRYGRYDGVPVSLATICSFTCFCDGPSLPMKDNQITDTEQMDLFPFSAHKQYGVYCVLSRRQLCSSSKYLIDSPSSLPQSTTKSFYSNPNNTMGKIKSSYPLGIIVHTSIQPDK